jgi:hypothetical protein
MLDAPGVIDHVAQLPLDAVPADCVPRLVVQVGGEQITREGPLGIVQ